MKAKVKTGVKRKTVKPKAVKLVAVKAKAKIGVKRKTVKPKAVKLVAVKAFTISRRRWLRGEGASRSKLVRGGDGKQCCLGTYLLACGVPRTRMVGENMPYDLALDVDVLPKDLIWLFKPYRNKFADGLAEVNDAVVTVLDDDEREEKVAELFAKHGVKVTFK